MCVRAKGKLNSSQEISLVGSQASPLPHSLLLSMSPFRFALKRDGPELVAASPVTVVVLTIEAIPPGFFSLPTYSPHPPCNRQYALPPISIGLRRRLLPIAACKACSCRG